MAVTLWAITNGTHNPLAATKFLHRAMQHIRSKLDGCTVPVLELQAALEAGMSMTPCHHYIIMTRGDPRQQNFA